MKKISSVKKVYSLAKEYNKGKQLHCRRVAYESSLQNLYALPERVIYGNNKFSIISAVYGVEKYLDKYISTLVKQTLSFIDHIELILVDDGSVDGSAEICKKWAEKYPDNIIYHRQENGGQASARNAGLKLASYDWVTFIDPDDFVDLDYFKNIDAFLKKNQHENFSFIGANFIFFMENEYRFKDTHPLKYRFAKGERITKFDKHSSDIQMSASTAIFKKSLIGDLQFESLKPDFEDSLFVAKFIINNIGNKVAFLPNVKYYYRKREDSSSTLDTAWQKDEKFSTVITDGYLNVVSYAINKIGYVPKWLQKSLVYATSWYVKYLYQHHARQSAIAPELQLQCLYGMRELYKHIDQDILLNIKQPVIGYFWLYGLAKLFKGLDVKVKNVVVSDYDNKNELVCVKYNSTTSDQNLTFVISGNIVEPIYYKCQNKTIWDETFIFEHTCWLKCPGSSELKVYSENEEQLDIILFGSVEKSITKSAIQKKRWALPRHANKNVIARLYRKLSKTQKYQSKYKNAWLLMDRDTQADDNAEHLYRYMLNQNVKENIFFVLRKSSHDWKRLHKEGFRLIEFGSIEHIMAMLNAEFLISSHADRYVTNLLNHHFYKDLLKFKFIFLQHGVIKDDLSEWLNTKNIRQFICAAQPEYDSISGPYTNYKFTEYDTALTGLPRHDSLLSQNNESSRKIVIMPTWRQNLVGYSASNSNQRERNTDFEQSNYYKAWSSFVESQYLRELCEKYNYEVLFFPHVNVQPYFKSKKIEGVKVLSHNDVDSIQRLFSDSALMITDYSSVAFESAYLKKAIVYYQFDRDEIYSGGHIYKRGYFDYERDGFGPVCVDEASLLNEIEELMKNDCHPQSPYIDRIENFFPFRDGKCCERVYNLIKNS